MLFPLRYKMEHVACPWLADLFRELKLYRYDRNRNYLFYAYIIQISQQVDLCLDYLCQCVIQSALDIVDNENYR